MPHSVSRRIPVERPSVDFDKLCAFVVASVLWLTTGHSLASPGDNRLKNHPSAYLAMHGADPVQWRLWDASAVARRTDKLLFVSIGYYACHWCHVMHRESYRNESIATFLNTNFVAVKIDRELEPALDQYLMTFVKRTRGYAGWPLNVFITPEGYPLFGTTYLPPEDFNTLLEQLRERWTSEKASLKRTAEAAFHRLATRQSSAAWPPPVSAAIVAEYRQRFLENTLERADTLRGGFGDARKFPAVPQLRTLLAIYRLDPTPALAEFLHLSLRET
ncbi:MAG: DUF255 domain-containing protein [Gammaproteobacteria bacterium]